MGRSCDFGICRKEATRIATFTAERSERRTKAACDLQHELGVGREIITAGWTPEWRMLPGAVKAQGTKADPEPEGAA